MLVRLVSNVCRSYHMQSIESTGDLRYTDRRPRSDRRTYVHPYLAMLKSTYVHICSKASVMSLPLLILLGKVRIDSSTQPSTTVYMSKSMGACPIAAVHNCNVPQQ